MDARVFNFFYKMSSWYCNFEDFFVEVFMNLHEFILILTNFSLFFFCKFPLFPCLFALTSIKSYTFPIFRGGFYEFSRFYSNVHAIFRFFFLRIHENLHFFHANFHFFPEIHKILKMSTWARKSPPISWKSPLFPCTNIHKFPKKLTTID